MPATTPLHIQEQIRQMRTDGTTIAKCAEALSVSVWTASKYGPKRPAPRLMPRAKVKIENDGTLRSAIALKFGVRTAAAFQMKEIREAFAERHPVLVRRTVGELVKLGILRRVDQGLYIGNGRA